MKDTNHHDCLLEWLVKDQIVAELRHDEPADLRVTRSSLADAPAKLTMPAQKVGGIEDDRSGGLAPRFRIVGGNVTTMLVQIAPRLLD